MADIPWPRQSRSRRSHGGFPPALRLDDPGVGFETANHRVLTYSQLQSIEGWPDKRPAEREVELHLTGNMERYMWSFDGKKFSEVDGLVKFYHGERLRLILVNDSMMDHPIHCMACG